MSRLKGADASFLYMENPVVHMHVSGVMILDPSTMEGGYSFERFRDHVVERLHLIPMFRHRLLRVPLGRRLPAAWFDRAMQWSGPAEVDEERGVVDVAGVQQVQQVTGERGDCPVVDAGGEAELGPHPAQPGGLVTVGEVAERRLGQLDRPLGVVIDQRQQRLAEPRQVPIGDARLVGIGIAAAEIGRAHV